MSAKAILQSAIPVFSTGDLYGILDHYRELGFECTTFGEEYALAKRDRVLIHIQRNADHGPHTAGATFIEVSNPDAVAALSAEWAKITGRGFGGESYEPAPTDYGYLVGMHIDPAGNQLRFGTRIP